MSSLTPLPPVTVSAANIIFVHRDLIDWLTDWCSQQWISTNSQTSGTISMCLKKKKLGFAPFLKMKICVRLLRHHLNYQRGFIWYRSLFFCQYCGKIWNPMWCFAKVKNASRIFFFFCALSPWNKPEAPSYLANQFGMEGGGRKGRGIG